MCHHYNIGTINHMGYTLEKNLNHNFTPEDLLPESPIFLWLDDASNNNANLIFEFSGSNTQNG